MLWLVSTITAITHIRQVSLLSTATVIITDSDLITFDSNSVLNIRQKYKIDFPEKSSVTPVASILLECVDV